MGREFCIQNCIWMEGLPYNTKGLIRKVKMKGLSGFSLFQDLFNFFRYFKGSICYNSFHT